MGWESRHRQIDPRPARDRGGGLAARAAETLGCALDKPVAARGWPLATGLGLPYPPRQSALAGLPRAFRGHTGKSLGFVRVTETHAGMRIYHNDHYPNKTYCLVLCQHS